MKVLLSQGPVQGPALGVFPTSPSDGASPHIRPRRQIGTGSRSIIMTSPARISSRRIAQPVQRGRTMKRTTVYLTTALGVALSLAALGIGAAVDTPRTLMSPAVYSQGKKAIEAETRIAFASCRSREGAARDICKAEARAAERVKVAELQARYHGTVAAAEDAREARVKAQFEVAKAHCGARIGEARVECLRSVREDRSRALADAKLAST